LPGAIGKNNFCGRLSRWTVNDVNNPTAFTNEQPIVSGLPSFSATGAPNDDSHTVGTVIAASDGSIIFGNGEASSWSQAEDTSFFAGDWTSPRGKILRVDANGNPAPGNPRGGSGNFWESRIFAVGMRNPFRFTLKPGTGVPGVPPVLYIGDVGSAAYDEINVARGGENFGWPCYEGPISNHNEFAGDPRCADHSGAGVVFPLWSYAHDLLGPGNAVIGGAFYTGSSYGPLNGSYIFGDAVYGVMWALKTDGADQLVSGPSGRDDWFVGPHNSTVEPTPDGGVG